MKLAPVAALALLAAPAAAQDPAAIDLPTRVTGFSAADIDKTVQPCTDFYQYACGGWLARNPVPADQARWGRFNELSERNDALLRTILEKASVAGPSRSPLDRRIGDAYAACMDEKVIEEKGLAPLQPMLDRIGAAASKEDLPALVAYLHTLGVNALFRFGSIQDFKDATAQIAVAAAGGLGLPDRDYYLKDDAKSLEIRNKYRAHVTRVFELAGDEAEMAAARAKTVMDIETALAKGSLDRVSRRDPVKLYNKMGKEQFAALAPAFGWAAYFEAVGAPSFTDMNVTEPAFFQALQEEVRARGAEAWRTYLRWHLLRAASPLLPAAFVEENFAFFGKALTGAEELRPRWKRCVERVDDDLGEALGQRYVELTFGADGKERMARLVSALERALEKDIRELPWMGEATKTQALGKLKGIANKVGYPDTWRDYSSVTIFRDDALGNTARAAAFETARDLGKIGKPVDRGEWRMSPPTVNAYYQPLMNDINFPAGILQPPFFDRTMDDAVNLGAIGAVIGHELSHGFDDQGRKFDQSGNMRDWWTAEDAKKFEERTACMVDQYAGYTIVDDVKINGRLTLGENVADNGGVRIALMALQDLLGPKGAPPIDGFTPEQRAFLAWGQVWCQNQRDEMARLRAQTDPHSPGRYRVNGVVSNMPEFAKAFSCPAGSPMVREKPCRIW
jgi:endothelin-converting enzyme/putative endopeptidase